MNNSSIIAILLLCAKGHGRNIRKPTRRHKNAVQRNVVSSSAFGTALFSELCAQLPPESNVLFSPLSVYQALALVKDGASDKSDNESELEKILGPQWVQDEANSLQMQSGTYDADAGVEFSMATSIWANGLKPSYINRAKRTQSAECFSLPKAFTAVDKWIKNKTNGMIKDMMGDGLLDSSIVALLVNAVYFKGTWSYEFDPNKTVPGKFRISGRSMAEAKYMTAHRRMDVISQSSALGDAKVLILDYGEREKRSTGSDAEFSAIFVLPASAEDESMNSVISGLNSRPISELLKEVQTTDVMLRLPRFKLEFGPSSLKPFLQSMGMRAAFQKCPSYSRRLFRSKRRCKKFDRMSDDPWLYVDDVLHGACMEITEEGTEAAAATAVIMKTRSARPRTFEMTFDRPFVVVIWHWQTETPLFIAKVQNPVSSS